MEFQISEESIGMLSEYADLSIAFEYDSILELTIIENGLGGFFFTERRLSAWQRKDYDEFHGEGPLSWSSQFDLTNWGLLIARTDDKCIGGTAIAWNTANVDMLEKRMDMAVLWDIRVDPTFRGHGIGASLFQAAEIWSATRKCTQLKIETQNTNLAACKFYAKQGCQLGAINRFAYPALPDEIQMLWYKDLA